VRERKTKDSVKRNADRTLNIDLATHSRDAVNLMIPE
jgi:hypothetical protein